MRVEDVDGEEWVNLHFADGAVVYGWNREMRRSVVALDDSERCTEPWHDDTPDIAATARAVVRTAAEIGKAMT